MSTKNIRKIILIVSIILIYLFLYFNFFSKKPEVKIEVNNPPLSQIMENLEFKYDKTENISVYDFMNKLKDEGQLNFQEKNYVAMGKFIEEINGIKNGEKNWIYYVNEIKADSGVSNYQIKKGDILSWKYESR